MQPDAKAFLFDIQRAAELIAHFTAGRTVDDYLTDPMLRSAVERQLTIIGEALSQLSKLDAALTARIGEYPRIIAFRNVLIHAYARIDNQLVWEILKTRLPILHREVDALLGEP